jgi:methyl-accepting chemotaxis protein
MSILETFYILFKSDSKEVKKGAEEAKKSTEDLAKSLDKVNTGANRVGESFVGMGRSIAGAAAALLTVGAVIGNIKEAYKYTLGLDQTSKALNVNIETLDAWGRAVQKNGGTAQGFQSSIQSLAKNLNIRNSDAIRMLPMLADSFKRVGADRSMRFGQSIGLDQATIMLLQQGRREVEAVINRQKELGTVTQRDAEIAGEFNDKWTDMTFAFRMMWVQVGSIVLPILGKIVDGFTEVAKSLQKHANFIIGAFIGMGAAILFFTAPLIAANAVVIGIGIAIAVAIAAFALLFEDIVAFVNGNESAIGHLIKRWPIVGEVFKTVFQGIRDTINSVIESFKFLFAAIEKVGSLFSQKWKDAHPFFGTIPAMMNEVDNNPLGSQTSNSILNGGNTKSTSINTGPITINTQATNGEEVSGALARGLRDQLRQATGTFDDGVLA